MKTYKQEKVVQENIHIYLYDCNVIDINSS